LHRDCSIPILVFDVDGDGDNDVVWARGHSTGLYWFEQQSERLDSTEDRQSSGPENTSQSRRKWVLHAIDTSWSQAHSLLLGDLDGDGHREVIAGKRYLGHEGNDLGEYDPMMIGSYQYDATRRTWRRLVVSEGGPAGFGLDPKLADLDSDGDLDLVCPGRSGLHWIENLLVAESTPTNLAGSEPAAPRYSDHAELLHYADAEGHEQPVANQFDWGIRRAHVLDGLEQAMGELPGPTRRVPLDVRVLEETETPHYLRRKLTFSPDPGDRVPAYLLIPHRADDALPAMLCLHQTTANGKDEPAGIGGNPHFWYADELARRGYVCLVPDYPSFGEYEYDFNQRADAYASGSMKAVWNNVRAIDLLESLPMVDRDRIGCIGHSLGGHNALFTAVFDQRIKAVVASSAFSAFHDDDLPSWSGERYMPRIRELFGNDPDQMPFDFHEVVAAIAPRPVFINAPIHDRDFDVSGVKKVIESATKVFELLAARDRMTAVFPDAPHDFPDPVRRQAYEWLDHHLNRGR
jgi:dienelactone hydrolase